MRVDKPFAVEHRYEQRLVASPGEVFPLLCPVRELEWVPGWRPTLVVSASGVAEEGCVFVTAGEDGESTWVVTRYEPPREIEFVKLTPGVTVGLVSIVLSPGADPGTTAAEVRYRYTALGERGERAVREFTAEHYLGFMGGWEDSLNHFLATGTMITSPPAEP